MLRWPEALGAGGADIILLQHLEHGGAGNARDQRDVDAAERDGRQDQVLQPWPEAFGERRVALHRKPFEFEREHIGEDVSDHKDRKREAEHGECHDGAVDPASRLPGRDHAERHRDHDGQDEGERHQRQRRLDPLRDQGRDRQVGEDRGAEIAVQDAPEPAPELDQERPVEAEALANALNVGGARLVAGDHRRRIARRDVEQAEHEQRDDRHHRHGRQNAPEDIREHVGSPRRHAVFDTPQKKGSGPFTIPETFLRHAV